MDAPDLVIPIRFDPSKAIAGLQTVEAAGAKAGDEVAEGMGRADKAAGSLSDSIGGLIKGQMTYAAIKGVAQSIGEQFKEAADRTREMAKDFIALRQTMQEVATLQGKPVTTEFTLEQAQKAKAAHLTPAEFRDFQAQFLNYAGAQVGGEAGKLTETQGAEYASRVAEMMKASGVTPKVGAELAGSLLENVKGPQDVDKLMTRFGTAFQVLQKGRVPLERALPEISQIMGMGVELEEAAQMYSIVSPAAAGQEGTAVQAALRAVQEMKSKGTGEEFGVRKGMTPFESVRAFAEDINQRKQELTAGGATEQMAQDEISALLMEQKVANDIREARGLVSGFGRQGIELGGFARYGKVAAETPADYEKQKIAEYEASETGKQAEREADLALAKAQRGALATKYEELRTEAETELTRSGRTERPEALDLIRKSMGAITGESVQEQLVTEKAFEMAQERAGRPVNEYGQEGSVFGLSRVAAREKTEALLARQTEIMEEEANRPLAVSPPGGNRDPVRQ